jgi:hypothetical protein
MRSTKARCNCAKKLAFSSQELLEFLHMHRPRYSGENKCANGVSRYAKYLRAET